MSRIVDAEGLRQALCLPIKKETVLRWSRTGLIPHLQTPGRPVLFDIEDVRHALQKSTAAGRQEVAGVE